MYFRSLQKLSEQLYDRLEHIPLKFEQSRAARSPLPDGERSDCEAIRVRGLRTLDSPEPPHPDSSPKGERERAVLVALPRSNHIEIRSDFTAWVIYLRLQEAFLSVPGRNEISAKLRSLPKDPPLMSSTSRRTVQSPTEMHRRNTVSCLLQKSIAAGRGAVASVT